MRPVCLPFKNEYSIEDVWKKGLSGDPSRPIKAWVAGWGKTRWNVEGGSNVLQEVQLPLVSNEQCSYNYSTRVALSDKQVRNPEHSVHHKYKSSKCNFICRYVQEELNWKTHAVIYWIWRRIWLWGNGGSIFIFYYSSIIGGDSGGPLMYPLQLRGDGKFFQIGIVSFGPVQCGQSGTLQKYQPGFR